MYFFSLEERKYACGDFFTGGPVSFVTTVFPLFCLVFSLLGENWIDLVTGEGMVVPWTIVSSSVLLSLFNLFSFSYTKKLTVGYPM